MPSNVIKNFDYKNEVLEIEFRSGRIYRYIGVPEKIYRDFRMAFSKGRFFDSFIREKFKTKKIG